MNTSAANTWRSASSAHNFPDCWEMGSEFIEVSVHHGIFRPVAIGEGQRIVLSWRTARRVESQDAPHVHGEPTVAEASLVFVDQHERP